MKTTEDELAIILRDKYTFARRVCVDETPDAHTVWIKIGVQSFCIDGYQDTKKEADWMRLMIGKAFVTMLATASPAPPDSPNPNP